MTLVDVAQRASVSVATVSRALSGDPQISEATRHVFARSRTSLKYVPNVAARNLVQQSSATFGLMTPDVTDPIHGQVVTGFQQQAAEHDYSVILANGFRRCRDRTPCAARVRGSPRRCGRGDGQRACRQREVKRLMSPSPVLFIGSEHVTSQRCRSPDQSRVVCVRTTVTACARWSTTSSSAAIAAWRMSVARRARPN